MNIRPATTSPDELSNADDRRGRTVPTSSGVAKAHDTSPALGAPLWSAIVIARNEAARIGRCLASLTRALEGRSHEILVVDSASTDDTARIVKGLGIRIVRIPGDFPLSPAAGRHVGYLHARGSLLLFMDGDSDLMGDWLDAAEAALADPRTAGVAGFRRLVDSRSVNLLRADQYSDASATTPVASEHLGGPAAYRRDVLLEVGGFNPFLRAYEEAELGGRIRHAGYALLRLPVPMTHHYVTGGHESHRDLIRRARAGYLLGRGQLLRYGVAHHCVAAPHVEGLSRLVGFAVLELALLVGFVLAVSGLGSAVLEAAAVAMLALFAVFALRARSLRKPLYYFCEWAVAAPMFILGFLGSPRRADEYPAVAPAP